MDPVKLYHPDGRAVLVDTPTDLVNLKAQGYSETQPSADAAAAEADSANPSASASVAPGEVDPTDPSASNAQDVVAYLHEHPETAATVRAAEEASPRPRKTVLDAVAAVSPEPAESDGDAD